MEESRGIASSPATGQPEAITHEAVRDPCEEWFNSIFGVDGPHPDPEARSKHQMPKLPAKFRSYESAKNYFYPRVVSLGPYHYGKLSLKAMEEHKITAIKRSGEGFIDRPGERRRIYQEFIKVKRYYAAKGVARLTDDDFARMMFLDGCFVLHFIDKINKEAETILEISNDLIPLIIRDMFLMENQLPFEVLDALMNLQRGSSSVRKEMILEFIKWNVLIPMGFLPVYYPRLSNWCRALDDGERDSPLHLLDVLRIILLDFPPSSRVRKQSNRPRNFGSVTELKEIGIRFEKRRMESLMDISFEEHLLFPRLLLPKLFINDTTISQLLNLTAFEACSDTYSGCGVTSFIQFMDSLINDDADVKMLRSKGILHHSLGSDDELARLFNTWPADVTNDLKLYSYISGQILKHRDRRVNISIATWWDKYFGSPWTAISFVAAVLLLVFTAIQTYFAAFSGR